MPISNDAAHFAHLIDTLSPWLGEVTIVGGWAHRLYRLHPLAQELDYEPLATYDTDVALPSHFETSDEDIRQRLLANDFREELLGDTRPPVAQYHVVSGDSGFYAEFLTPLRGNALRRTGERDATVRIAGVSAQKLRYLEILLQRPWEITIGPGSQYPTTSTRTVRLPNATAFLTQKALIHDRRERADRAKDILYIHDTIETFASHLPELREEWLAFVRPTLHANAVRRVEATAEQIFHTVDDTTREASLIAPNRGLPPERLLEVCRYGWDEIFGSE